jgi:hypothetical protein
MRVRIYSEKRVDFPHDAEKPTVKLGIEIVALEASVIAQRNLEVAILEMLDAGETI